MYFETFSFFFFVGMFWVIQGFPEVEIGKSTAATSKKSAIFDSKPVNHTTELCGVFG